ncbi:hypothetical protein [Nostoc sp. T09]|uniref:hypothetical protein n=1 Tax=Nostoc sp. T09 TaxID=1932621 RepID=UPI0011808B79|nr:hypothetical protein [Nostoc sp. T09]
MPKGLYAAIAFGVHVSRSASYIIAKCRRSSRTVNIVVHLLQKSHKILGGFFLQAILKTL